MKTKIIIPGSIMADITGYAKHLPIGGESAFGELLRTSPGGKGSNQMIAAHRAGAEALLIGCTGNDGQAAMVTDFYNAEGIPTKYVRRVAESFTGTALIEVDTTTAQNRILVVPGANLCVSKDDVINASCDIANCDIVLAQLEIPDEPILESAKLAKANGKTFILNPAPYRVFPEELFPMIDYFTPNETEAEYFSGVHIESVEDASYAAKVLIQKGIKNVIITLGSKGAFYSNGEKELFVPSFKVEAVETTGAGDSFNGAFAVAIGEGMDVGSAMRFANAAAGISVTRYGTAQSMATRDEIEELLKAQ